MEVNFNTLRKALADEYNKLVSLLNDGKLVANTYGTPKEGSDISADVLVSSDDIVIHLDRIQNLIGTLAACYNDHDVEDISNQIELQSFNLE